ncbi:MAG: MATE family efflux transporter [Spirochaetes bacterium]|nr:MATE family efflux transporter [Spirochaetota bacterium]
MENEDPANTSAGVKNLLGTPKKALIRLAIPNSFTLLITVIYQITDLFWISGLGADALASIGFLLPFVFFLYAVAQGLSTGGGTRIAQFIGAHNKEQADRTAAHTFIFALIISIPVIVIFALFMKSIMLFMGAGRLINTVYNLGLLYLPVILLLVFNHTSSGMLMNEGDAKRAMIASLSGTVLNIFLDPLFIYYFKFGIYGTVLATLVSLSVSCSVFFYWYFLKKNTYVSVKFKNFKFDKQLSLSIIKLGLPVTLSQASTSFMVFVLTSIISIAAGTDGVAVYTTGFRNITYLLLPTYGVPYAIGPIAAAALGNRDYHKMKTIYYFGFKISFFITLIMAAAMYYFATELASVFTRASDSSRITGDLIVFFRIFAWYLPGISIWMSTICFFVGIGYSIFDVLFNSGKHFLYTIPLVYVFGIIFNAGLPSIWAVVTIGMWVHGISAHILLRTFLSRYKKTGSFAFTKKTADLSIQN